MQAIEFETTVDAKGDFHLPEKYRDVYGKRVRLVVLLPQAASETPPTRIMNPMQYGNTLDWPMDGLAYQQQVRGEWE